MSFLYWLSKFSQEAMLVELFLIGLITTAYFGYLLLQKRKYGVSVKQIPDSVVRAYLMEMISHAEGFKNQLFGDSFKIGAGQGLSLKIEAPTTTTTAATTVNTNDGAETAALKQQLAGLIGKQDELTKTIAQLNADKQALEQKAGSPVAGGSDPQVAEKISKLESRLAEYEVIEDDLANLKKYQQENKQLKAQLEAMQKGGAAPAAAPEPVVAAPAPAPTPTPEPVAVAPVPEPVAAAPTPEPVVAAAPPAPEPVAVAPVAAAPAPTSEPAPIAVAEQNQATKTAEAGFEGLVDKIEESLAPPTPAGASAADPAAQAAAAAVPALADAPVPAAGDAPKPDKSDADLLNEFERMLSS